MTIHKYILAIAMSLAIPCFAADGDPARMGKTNTGDFTVQSATDSTTAVQVLDAAGTPVINVDTTNERVGIGTNTPTAALDVVGAIATSRATTPGFTFEDLNGTDSDDNGWIYGNLTDTGSGSEDFDFYLSQQVDGVPTTWLFVDADGNLELGNQDQLVVVKSGVLSLPEISTPIAIGSSGAFYTKPDNKPYFQDGTGTEHVLTTGPADYGEMGNVYGSSATETLVSADEWHAMFHANITGSDPHLNSGFSFVAGMDGSGTTTTAQGGSSINIADAAHGLATGDIVTVQSANHAGVGTVLYVDAGNFEVDITYVGDEAITWQMGSYLLAATAGTYRGVWTGSFSQSLNNTQTSVIAPFISENLSTKAVAASLLANNTDAAVVGGNGLLSVSVGDRVWFATKTTAAQTLTFIIRDVTLH